MSEQLLTQIIGALQAVVVAMVGAGMISLRRVSKDAATTRAEVKNNHGSSLRDAVDRLESLAVKNSGRIDTLEELANKGLERLETVERGQADARHEVSAINTRLGDHIQTQTTTLQTIRAETSKQ